MKNLLEQSYCLRHSTYCLDRKFLPDTFPDRKEQDQYDKVCEHLFYTENEKCMGTMRVIPWSSVYRFPLENRYQFLQGILAALDYPIEYTAELSRFCISRGCDNRVFASMSLFRDLYLFSKRNGITHWIAGFEESLSRILNRYGFKFKKMMEDSIQYYGEVFIYGIIIEELEEHVKRHKKDLYNYFMDDLNVRELLNKEK